MIWLKKWWRALAAAGIFLLGLIAALAASARGNRAAAAKARADATEKIAQKHIDDLNAKLESLAKDETKNGEEIKTTRADIDEKRKELNEKFESHGLSVDEIAERFRRLRL